MEQKRTLIGIVTFGNVYFTILTIRSILKTTNSPIELFVVVAKPADMATSSYLTAKKIPHKVHEINQGFPASINDIYDWAWKHWSFDNLILAGNDIVPYPGAIDALIEQANTTEFEWIAASMFDVESLLKYYPEERAHFDGPNLNFNQWNASGEPMVRPWERHNEAVSRAPEIIDFNREGPALIKDVRNLCLFKRSVFETLGYADVNFWPGGYFEDNDYARRAVNAGIESCALNSSQYFHFWSRTIHQGSGAGEEMPQGRRDYYFALNEGYYRQKWGGPFGQEQHSVPFNGRQFSIPKIESAPPFHSITLPTSLKIPDRENESHLIEYWSSLR